MEHKNGYNNNSSNIFHNCLIKLCCCNHITYSYMFHVAGADVKYSWGRKCNNSTIGNMYFEGNLVHRSTSKIFNSISIRILSMVPHFRSLECEVIWDLMWQTSSEHWIDTLISFIQFTQFCLPHHKWASSTFVQYNLLQPSVRRTGIRVDSWACITLCGFYPISHLVKNRGLARAVSTHSLQLFKLSASCEGQAVDSAFELPHSSIHVFSLQHNVWKTRDQHGLWFHILCKSFLKLSASWDEQAVD